ncbi:SNF2-related protein [Ruminiclostridium papyrosolvens DSM 2782]|uniref:SNF2-related protein n=1 Tax=Ruminiclostridium papyrosolvens DSM 2782 TaxID=588581 RepID=F1TIK9_9FIRM|nr:SNF2-related protein [Ruminiclostridium papyrosolvens]EGD45826.1 SNF2-related protein [Ruminiclostridium papyrosolvens DSM 2782]WES33854.1 SNF2-related protein [Ruminiclostridium papyrosolvens DSM 2782]
MLENKMYVRCPVDKDTRNPRIFIMGQITEIDKFAETVTLKFNDPYSFRKYYEFFPETIKCSINSVTRCKIFEGTVVQYDFKSFQVIKAIKGENGWYTYYLQAVDDKIIKKVREDSIIAPFNSCEVEPHVQLMNYEFQNPIWYIGRTIVDRTMQILENSVYGFKVLAGCKIFLMPHQLHTIMRCLQETKCRYMLADEVGLGKTIEACSVLKIFLSQNFNARVLIIVPNTLLNQWKVELYVKFDIMVNEDIVNGNMVITSIENLPLNSDIYKWDFVIVDEVHRLLSKPEQYNLIHKISASTDNILLLSATPVQQKKNEYLKLLKLIMPEKYNSMTEDEFSVLLEKQSLLTGKVYNILNDFEDYREFIDQESKKLKDSEASVGVDRALHENEECEELFEELIDDLRKIDSIIKDDNYTEFVKKIRFKNTDFGVQGIEISISYICEHYQIEKSIIRNRRDILEETLALRTLEQVPHQLKGDHNNAEMNTYYSLVEWIELQNFNQETFRILALPLLMAYFSSPWAFIEVIGKNKASMAGDTSNIFYFAERWLNDENLVVNTIDTVLENPDDINCRIGRIVNFIDQEVIKGKIVVFTKYEETFTKYKEVFEVYFNQECCAFFNKKMSTEELELNVFRFQNDTSCFIMLCDESGGEGRNFQCADSVLHIDLPWDANAIEQRIGRLDRIGRDLNRDVKSVVIYTHDTIEEQLFRFWNEGLNVFNHSLSGLEIIMSEINDNIVSAVQKDTKYGLSGAIDTIIQLSKDMKNAVEREQHYDTAAIKFRPLFTELDKMVSYYNLNENELFAKTMMNWASLAGLNGHPNAEMSVITFDEHSFSPKSAENSMLIPPNWDNYINSERNIQVNNVVEMYENLKSRSNPTKKVLTRNIKGTFNRQYAIENDYLHFFAPGDDVFDCIVNNALKSCKGQSAAFAVKSDIAWKGLAFTWAVTPNETVLLEKNIPLINLSQFRNFLAVDQVTTFVPFPSFEDVPESKVLYSYNKIIDSQFIKKDIIHLGQRSKRGSFLNINVKYNVSNIEWFKQTYIREQWEKFVLNSYRSARKNAVIKFKEKSNIRGVKDELQRVINAKIASSCYYTHEKVEIRECEDLYEAIYQSLKEAKIKLRSACFVWMVKE